MSLYVSYFICHVSYVICVYENVYDICHTYVIDIDICHIMLWHKKYEMRSKKCKRMELKNVRYKVKKMQGVRYNMRDARLTRPRFS